MSELENKSTSESVEKSSSKPRIVSTWLALIPLFFTALAAVAVALTFGKLLPFNDAFIATRDPYIEEYKKRNAEFEHEMQETHRQLDAIDKALSSSPKTQPELALTLAVTELRTQVESIAGRIKTLEDAISSSPEKALSIPLLRKDVDLIQKSQDEEKVSVTNDLARLYDLNKWFLASIVTIVLATVGIALTNAFKAPPKA